MDENFTGYNIWIWNLSELDNSEWNDYVKNWKTGYDNIPSETINGIVVYTISAERGDHVGQPRFLCYQPGFKNNCRVCNTYTERNC